MDHDKLNELQQSAHALAALVSAAGSLYQTGDVNKAHNELAKLCQAMGEELVNAHKTTVTVGYTGPGSFVDPCVRAIQESGCGYVDPKIGIDPYNGRS